MTKLLGMLLLVLASQSQADVLRSQNNYMLDSLSMKPIISVDATVKPLFYTSVLCTDDLYHTLNFVVYQEAGFVIDKASSRFKCEVGMVRTQGVNFRNDYDTSLISVVVNDGNRKLSESTFRMVNRVKF